MNKYTLIAIKYIELLSFSDKRKKELRAMLLKKYSEDSFSKLHHYMSDDKEFSKNIKHKDMSQYSVKTRIEMHWPNFIGKDKNQFDKDQLNRTVLKAMPKHTRSFMCPEKWCTNPVIRLWESIRGHKSNASYPVNLRKNNKKKWCYVGNIRRYILIFLSVLQTVFATWYMKSILPYQGWALIDPIMIFKQNWQYSALQILPYLLQLGILCLFTILFLWVSAGFWTALMGFLQLLIGKDKYSISYLIKGNELINCNKHRTALIMPICNEKVERVFAGLRATWESVLRTGEQKNYDIYILSDSYNPDICMAEQKAWIELMRDVSGEERIFYRRRRRRIKCKSGNIDDFCRRWGSQYKYMVVLDADSVMSGECLNGLVRMMEANPNAGIIQSSPKASGMDTLYARCQQFATRVYGPLFTAGLHFWQLGESHYWGHNAIIRVKPFIEHCALAPLPGRGSFSGSILSHDFVEAALMRRAGWGVWIAYDLPGSYEELPPNLLDELKRDRRWCHGNLMNFRLFLVKGMHPVHRAMFLTGVMSYLSAPLWFMFLALSTALQVVHTLIEPQYFLKPRQLFPVWPQWRPELAIALFSTTILLLFLPKLLSIVLIWCKGAKPYGGSLRVLASLCLEMLLSMLLAPVRMLFHTIFIIGAFLGWEAVWHSPQRDDNATSWKEACKLHGYQMLLGLIWAGGIGKLGLNFLWWLSPIVFSLIFSPLVSVLSSRRTLGQLLKKYKLFLIPEEFNPPKELIDTDSYVKLNSKHVLENGFMHAIFHPAFNALASAMANSRHLHSDILEHARNLLIQDALKQDPEKLDRNQCLNIFSDPVILARMHYHLWQNGEKYPMWLNYYNKIVLNPQALNNSKRT